MKWKMVNIPSFRHYMVNEEGEVINKITGRQLKPYFNTGGYLRLDLRNGSERLQIYVHRLVAMVWIPNMDPETFTQVNHKDRQKLNNHVSNLEWCSLSENLEHRDGDFDSCRDLLEECFRPLPESEIVPF